MAFCNTQLIGKTFPPYRKVLTTDEALAYAAATDDDNPYYQPPHHLAPPLAVVTLSLIHGAAPILCDPDLFEDSMMLLRLVHLEEDITWHQPLRQNMALISRAVLAGVEERSSGEIMHIEVSIAEDAPDRPATPVATVKTLMFLRGLTKGARRSPVSGARPALVPTHKLAWTVAPDQSERYADASGDRNPIHIDDAVAQASGLKSRILHGLCTMAFAQRAVVSQFANNDPARLQRLRVAFSRPVYMGDTLTCDAALSAQAPNAVDFVVNNEAGRAVCTDGLAELRANSR